MRLGVLTHEFPPFQGGIGRYVASITRAAADQGQEVVVHAPAYGAVAGTEYDQGVKIVRFAGGVPSGRLDLWRYTRALRSFLRTERFDLYHIADWPPLLACGLVPGLYHRIARALTVTTVFGSELLRLRNTLVTRMTAERVFRASRRLAPISEYTARLLAEQFPKIGMATPIPLGVAPRWFGPHPPLRVSLSSGPKIVTVGRVVPDKGHLAVIQAIGLLPEHERRSIEYLIVGTGAQDYITTLTHAAARLGVRVHPLGYVPDEQLGALLARCLVHVIASRHTATRVEGFGLVVLEAAAVGLPTIATTVGGLPELIRDRTTGMLVPDGDVPQLSQAILRFLVEPSFRDALGSAALAHARPYTWDRAAVLTYAI